MYLDRLNQKLYIEAGSKVDSSHIKVYVIILQSNILFRY